MTEDSRLSKWSKRKLEARAGLPHAEEESRNSPALAAEGGIEQSHFPDDKADLPIPEDLEGIDLETVGEDFDFSRLLKSDVPAHLKRIGLRRLWRANPLYAALDGMNDYDDDYTDAAMGVQEMKGFFAAALRRQAEARQAEAKQAEARQAEAKQQAAALTEQPENPADDGPASIDDSSQPEPVEETRADSQTDTQAQTDPSHGTQMTDRAITEPPPQMPPDHEQDQKPAQQEAPLHTLARHGWLPI